jgi:hypothetical protein
VVLSVKEEALQDILKDLAIWRGHVPGLLHPMRAISLARAISHVSAAKIAETMGISRSYLAALENYTKPLTLTDNFYGYINSLAGANNNSAFSTVYKKFMTINNPDGLFEYVAALERMMYRELEDQFLHLIFETVTSMPTWFEILWEEVPGGSEGYIHLTEKEEIEWPSWWPPGQMPRAVLASSKQSSILSWLAGQISSDELISYYEGNPVGATVLLHRRQRADIKPSGLIALGIFMFSKINVSFSHSISYPVQCSAIFQGKVISNLFDPLTTWFDIENLVPSKLWAKAKQQ